MPGGFEFETYWTVLETGAVTVLLPEQRKYDLDKIKIEMPKDQEAEDPMKAFQQPTTTK